MLVNVRDVATLFPFSGYYLYDNSRGLYVGRDNAAWKSNNILRVRNTRVASVSFQTVVYLYANFIQIRSSVLAWFPSRLSTSDLFILGKKQ